MAQEASMHEALADLKKAAEGIVGAKRKGQDLTQLTRDGLLQILRVKDASKRVCTRVEAAKEATAVSKQGLEAADSVLQNLLYEKNYYTKEIHACRSFTSQVKDGAVDLMPEDQFLAALSNSEEDAALRAQAAANPHERMKARLIYENQLRQRLVERLNELKQMKHTLQDSVNNQQKALTDLQARLKAVESTAKPLQTVLGSAVQLKGRVSRAADLLPTPLYIAYSQVIAAGEAMQMGCSATVVGSADEAEAYARSLAQEATETGAASTSQPTTQEDLYKPHPLSVEIHVYKETTPSPSALKPPSILITVVLQYLPALRVVTGHCKDPADNAVLKSLFPADDGSAMPMEGLAQLQAGQFRFSAAQTARPYRWCQHVAGLDFVPTLPQLALQLQPGDTAVDSVLSGLDAYRRQQRVATVVARLRQAKQSEQSLNQQVSPAFVLHNYLPKDMTMYRGVPSSVLLAWELEATTGPTAAPVPSTPKTAKAAKGGGGHTSLGQQQKRVGEKRVREDGDLDEGELVDADVAQRQQQRGAGGVGGQGRQAGTSAAGGPPGPSEAGTETADVGETSEGGSNMWDGRNGVPGDMGADNTDNEDEEGALPDEPGEITASRQQQQRALEASEGSRDRDRRQARKASAALQVLLDAQEEAAAGQPPSQRPRPHHRRYRLVARTRLLEVEAALYVFSEYPLRPPVLRVCAVRPLPPAAWDAVLAAMSGNKGRSLQGALSVAAGESLGQTATNLVAWIESEVNAAVLQLIPKTRPNDTLCYQLTHLRFALDAATRAYEVTTLAQQGSSASGQSRTGQSKEAEDHAALYLRQQLVGRARQPASLGCAATE